MKETSETPGLKHVLDSLVETMRITAGHSAPVVLMPHEARVLTAEVERLRGERAAVVAWLREKEETARIVEVADAFDEAARRIERGEHRPKEEE